MKRSGNVGKNFKGSLRIISTVQQKKHFLKCTSSNGEKPKTWNEECFLFFASFLIGMHESKELQ